jgi:small membrane protein
MIAQLILSILLAAILLYAWTEYRRSPAVAVLAVFAATAGLYFVWVPEHSTQLAELVGIGRGVDLILYIWVCISLIVLLNLHLKLRTQTELITTLARKVALAEARSDRPPDESAASSVRTLNPAGDTTAKAPRPSPTSIGLARVARD